jgi:Cu(I)/Ag(I) efflux system membrane protein CusA/SilA
MIGGMVSSTLLTLLVIPALFALVKGWRLQPEPAAPASIEMEART